MTPCMHSCPPTNAQHVLLHSYGSAIMQVMDTLELRPLAHCLVGSTKVSGLSLEARKRLTIAVELVGNPSILFLDEVTVSAW